MTFGERFLVEGRRAATPTRWGGETVDLELPGGGWHADGLSAAQAAGVRERFGRFCAAPPPPILRVGVRRAHAAAFRSWRELRGEFTLDLRRRPGHTDVAGIAFVARLRWRPRARAVLCTPEGSGEAFASLLENLLRVGVAYRVGAAGGVLLHGASILLEDGVLVCIGHSGAGKSTLSRLALGRGMRVLSDDLTAVSWAGDRAVVEAVPFAGELRPTAPAPGRHRLRAVVRLRQGEQPVVRDLAAGEAVAQLVGCAPTVNQDPYRADAMVAVAERLTRAVPVGELTFAPDDSVWPVVDRWLGVA